MGVIDPNRNQLNQDSRIQRILEDACSASNTREPTPECVFICLKTNPPTERITHRPLAGG
jgi:hypothetical protein